MQYNISVLYVAFQGPKLTLLGRCQLVTEMIICSHQIEKCRTESDIKQKNNQHDGHEMDGKTKIFSKVSH